MESPHICCAVIYCDVMPDATIPQTWRLKRSTRSGRPARFADPGARARFHANDRMGGLDVSHRDTRGADRARSRSRRGHRVRRVSVALVVMGLSARPRGRAIDRCGGRGVLTRLNLVLALGLVALGLARMRRCFAAWCVLGLGMGLGLYEAAFATLVRIHGSAARGPITGITLIAGFASTVGWPVTVAPDEHFGWRASCFAWAGDVRLRGPAVEPAAFRKAWSARQKTRRRHQRAKLGRSADRRRRTVARSRCSRFRRGDVVRDLGDGRRTCPASCSRSGGAGAALTASALLGPAQVAARLTKFLAARRFRFHPFLTARIATAFHPVAGPVLALFGGPAAGVTLRSVPRRGQRHDHDRERHAAARDLRPVGYGHRQGC